MKRIIMSFLVVFIIFTMSACSKPVQVTFDYMDLKPSVLVEVTDGKVVEPTDVSMDDYIFLGWFNEENFETPFDFDQSIEASVTAYGSFVSEASYIADVLPLNYASHDVYYEIFVRSFADSNNDGIGDFNGITQNLDYLESLGITALWLMPINPSPSYHGYDVTDFYAVNEDYGTMADFENLVDEANERNIDIIIDLVVNHTSDQHPWYESAVSSEDSPYRDWYVFEEGSNSGFESFVGGMKDLNYDNPDVTQEIKNIMAFYIDKGVHGFRLDAVKHIFEYEHGHSDIDLDAALLIYEWNSYIQSLDPNAYIVSEAWYGSYQDYATYYLGSNSVFDFDARDELFSRVGLGESPYLFVDKLIDFYDEYRIYRPDFIDAMMIGNHDMDRIASTAGFNSYNQDEKLKLAASIQLTLPGNPFIYYGEEIAMKGYRDYSQDGFNLPGYGMVYDEVRRTPFVWGENDFQTTWYDDDQNNDTIDVMTQMNDETSLWSHYQTMIDLRKNNPALMYGNEMTAYIDNSSAVQGFIRYYADDHYEQAVLVIHNVSKKAVTIELEGDYTILYGSLDMPLYSTLIVEIDSEHIGDYS